MTLAYQRRRMGLTTCGAAAALAAVGPHAHDDPVAFDSHGFDNGADQTEGNA